MDELDKRHVAYTGDINGEFSNNVSAQTAKEELLSLKSLMKLDGYLFYTDLEKIVERISFYEKQLKEMGFEIGKDLSDEQKEQVKSLSPEDQEKFQVLYEVHGFLKSIFNAFSLSQRVEITINA